MRTLELHFPFPPAAVTELFAAVVRTHRGDAPRGGPPSRPAGFVTELTRLFQEHNIAVDGTTTVVREYLDVQARVA